MSPKGSYSFSFSNQIIFDPNRFRGVEVSGHLGHMGDDRRSERRRRTETTDFRAL